VIGGFGNSLEVAIEVQVNPKLVRISGAFSSLLGEMHDLIAHMQPFSCSVDRSVHSRVVNKGAILWG